MRFPRMSVIALVLAAPLAFAQSSTQVPATPPVDSTTPAPEVIVLPEKIIETNVDLSTGAPQSGQSAYDARKEAVNALAEVKRACRREAKGSAQTECLRQAQDDYNAVMARTSGRQR